MRLNRSNYELWFTDWLEGNLNEAEVEELKDFLKQNPDLEDELKGLTLVSLEPTEFIFSSKNGLKKSLQDISDAQLENLYIANLENDLSPEQKAELKEIIDRDENKRKKFEVIQKLKLYPLAVSFNKKSRIKKLTAGERIIRLSLIGLGAAATVAILIVAYLVLPATGKLGTQHLAESSKPDTLLIERQSSIFISKAIDFPDENIIKSGINNQESLSSERIILMAEQGTVDIPDSTPSVQRYVTFDMLEVGIPENIFAAYKPPIDVLQTFDPGYIPPLIDEYRSNVDRFLARLFHEKIMKDTISGSRPVERFELAFAGIKGLNKLFGWDMALKKQTDENGIIRSYNFSSKLLRFNAPVRKSENRL